MAEPAAPDPHRDHHHAHPNGSDDVTPVTESTEELPGKASVPARPLIGMVRLYQMAAGGRPSPCRHVPSCSTYAIEALQIHGAARGSWLTVRRLSRCHPWGTQGYDPVPDRKAA